MKIWTKEDIKELLLSKGSIDSDGCWYWPVVEKSGYGRVDQIRPRSYRAHILSYEVFKGKRTKGKHIMHSCNHKNCFNPEHLSEGTPKKNGENASRDGLYRTKLTEDEVTKIRQMREEGYYLRYIAKKFNVSEGHIHKIVQGTRRLDKNGSEHTGN